MQFSDDYTTIESGDYIKYNKDDIAREETKLGEGDEIYTIQI